MELPRKCRPTKFSEVYGQSEAISVLSGFVKTKTIPHALLFTGPSGTGKTTLARIVTAKLECGEHDCEEINCAEKRGIDMIRDINRFKGLCALAGKNKPRVWILDEFHKATSDAASSFLKILEEPPDHVYFMLATTDPHKLLSTIKTRCTEIKCKALDSETMKELVVSICEREKLTVEDEVVERLIQVADGSPRKALVILNQIVTIEGSENQLNAILSSDAQKQGIDIARSLINGSPWKTIAAIIKDCEDEPETIRRIVLGYAKTVLLGGGKLAPRAYFLIQVFRDHWFDCGHAGLVASCWTVSQK